MHPAPSTQRVPLDDDDAAWRVSQVDGDVKDVPMRVPGQVHLALLRAGLIQEPFHGKNELAQRWVAKSSWCVTRTLTVSHDDLARAASVLVQFDGLDTRASVRVNDTVVLEADNAFRQWTSCDIKPLLLHGNGTATLSVLLAAQVAFAAGELARLAPYPIPCERYPNDVPGRTCVRKPQCDFGWDWGPCFLQSGIHRSARLLLIPHAYLAAPPLVQPRLLSPDTWLVRFAVSATAAVPNVTLRASIQVHASSAPGAPVVATAVCERVPAPPGTPVSLQAEIRVPRGALAEFPLSPHVPCRSSVLLIADGDGDASVLADRLACSVGVRDVVLHRVPDDAGEAFFLRVRGHATFARGANLVPLDAFDARVSDPALAALVADARAAHMNMLRVWGGGQYLPDAFYAACDAAGIMVWQEFASACGLHPSPDAFLASIRGELEYQLRRLSRFACIVVWSGNNENEEALSSGWWPDAKANPQRYTIDYGRVFLDTVAERVATLQPDTAFWPSSPSNGPGAWGTAADATRGDTHYWGVWHGGLPLTAFYDVMPRFCSEFGFQAFPSLALLQAYTSAPDTDGGLNLASPDIVFRQRSPAAGNKGMLDMLLRYFRLPARFPGHVHVSQVVQALAIKIGVEHWRRHNTRQRTMGTLYWQLNDVWPGQSWSSIEYLGRWKLLHHAATRFYAPVLLSARLGDPEQHPDPDMLHVYASNDTPDPVTLAHVSVDVHAWLGDARVVYHAEAHNVTVPACCTHPLVHLAVPDTPDAPRYVRMRGKLAGPTNAPPLLNWLPLRGMNDVVGLPRAKVHAEVRANDTVTVRNDGPGIAAYVYLEFNEPGHLLPAHATAPVLYEGDNGFHLLPGEHVDLVYQRSVSASDAPLAVTLLQTLRDTY